MSNSDRQSVKAVVQKIVPEGNHGPYAVATAEGVEGSITFSLEPPIWDEPDWPKPGEFVLLHKFHQKRAGWRAMRARFFKPEDKQTANSRENAMNKITALIERWTPKFFSSEAEQIWEDWVDFKGRGRDDLKGLLEDDEIRDEFKARALFAVLTPSRTLCPFHWTGSTANFWPTDSFVGSMLESLSSDLLVYAAELVAEFYLYLKANESESTEYAMKAYNNHILVKLLGLLPKEHADRLFELFELRDPNKGWYHPLQDLLCNPEVDEKWKVKADRKMRNTIIQELFKALDLQEAPDISALHAYCLIVQEEIQHVKKSYSRELLLQQIYWFIQTTPKEWPGWSFFAPTIALYAPDIVRMVVAEGWERSCLPLLSNPILTAKYFQIGDSEDLKIAELMLEVLGKEYHQEAAEVIQNSIASYRKQYAEEDEERREEKLQGQERAQAEQAIIQKMKRSVD